MRLTPEAERKMERLPWHGNIRQLQHAMERAVIMADGNTIAPDDIDDGTVGAADTQQPPLQVESMQTLDDMERQMIERAMASCGGNMSAVAARLGISRQTLYNKIKRYGL